MLKNLINSLVLLGAFEVQSQSQNSLKDYFKNDFLIGLALDSRYILEQNSKANSLIIKEFNSITPENIMKAEVIHPQPKKYNFTLSDKYVEFGIKNKFHIAGHTLIWHSQLPDFAKNIYTKDSLKAFMSEHIYTVVSRYKGKIKSWDVVNEALNEDGTLRESNFYKVLGENYIKDAFELAAKADPKAELYYNDYNIEQPAKRGGAIKLIKKLQESGVKIDGVGIQGHWSLNGASVEEIEQSIIEFSKLGIKVAITELDITVLPNPWDLKGVDVNQNYENSPFMNPYPKALPDSAQNLLTERYKAIFKVFLKHKDKISRVTFWGLSDADSWLNGWPIKGRTNYPLLFDRNFQPKPAYMEILKLKTKLPNTKN